VQDSPLKGWYEQYAPHLYRRCVAILGDEDTAWDALQDTFVRAADRLDRYEGRAAPYTWLYRISTNVCLDLLRRQAVRRAEPLDDDTPPPAGDPGSDGRRAERVALVRSLLSHFEPRVAACAIHLWVDEMSKAEVARVTGLSVPTVRKYVRLFAERARRLLGEAA